jgi:hypothetical protein
MQKRKLAIAPKVRRLLRRPGAARTPGRPRAAQQAVLLRAKRGRKTGSLQKDMMPARVIGPPEAQVLLAWNSSPNGAVGKPVAPV